MTVIALSATRFLGAGVPFQVNRIAEDSLSNIWIGTQQNGLFRYERSTGRITPYLGNPNDPVNLLDDQVRTLMADNQNQLWIGTGEPFDLAITGGGLVRLDLATGKAKPYVYDPATKKAKYFDSRQAIVVADQHGTNDMVAFGNVLMKNMGGKPAGEAKVADIQCDAWVIEKSNVKLYM